MFPFPRCVLMAAAIATVWLTFLLPEANAYPTRTPPNARSWMPRRMDVPHGIPGRAPGGPVDFSRNRMSPPLFGSGQSGSGQGGFGNGGFGGGFPGFGGSGGYGPGGFGGPGRP
jgi:hypothetical protein